MKKYINTESGEITTGAAVAMAWYRSGITVDVYTPEYSNMISIHGEHREKPLDENTKQCKHIAESCDAYAAGLVYRCPKCGKEIARDEWPEMFKCPECSYMDSLDNWEQLSIWDFLQDVFNVEFRANGRGPDDLRSVQIMVACGGPNVYLDTATKDVELYWWTECARWPLSYDAVDALDDWAEEYWRCL